MRQVSCYVDIVQLLVTLTTILKTVAMKIGLTFFALRKCLINEESKVVLRPGFFQMVTIDCHARKANVEWIVLAKKYGFNISQQLLNALEKYAISEEKPKAKHSVETVKKSLGKRERDTLLKIIIGMAVDKYRYDPHAEKCGGVSRIKSALERSGIIISDDAIRGKLKEAEHFLALDCLEADE